jgi:3D (Asp-Asp-Asp) domain-containing protein
MGIVLSVLSFGGYITFHETGHKTNTAAVFEQAVPSHVGRLALNRDFDEQTTTTTLAESLPVTEATTSTSVDESLDRRAPSAASRGAPRVIITTTTTEAPPAPDTEASPEPAPSSDAGEVDLGEFSVTCYDLTGSTATGSQAGPGTIAVDPSVIPFGTVLRMNGYKGTAKDTGGAIKGHRLDIWMATDQDCFNWGDQTLEVYQVSE